MIDVKFVNAEDLSTLEEYGASLLSGMISLKTLESFHITAFNKGLLDTDEAETMQTIRWEIQRLLALYTTQMKHVLERTNVNEEQILESLKKMMPDVKIPRKRKQSKTKILNNGT
jgi:hypothetical protein